MDRSIPVVDVGGFLSQIVSFMGQPPPPCEWCHFGYIKCNVAINWCCTIHLFVRGEFSTAILITSVCKKFPCEAHGILQPNVQKEIPKHNTTSINRSWCLRKYSVHIYMVALRVRVLYNHFISTFTMCQITIILGQDKNTNASIIQDFVTDRKLVLYY